MLSFVQRWPWLLRPLGGATRFFREATQTASPAYLATPAVLWRALLILIVLGLCNAGVDLISHEMTAELRAALKRLPNTPYAEPIFPWPWSQLTTAPAFLTVWLVYLLLFAGLRWLSGRWLLDSTADWSFSRALVYSIYAAVPVMLIATLSKLLQLTLLPDDPAELLVPDTGAVYLPLVLFLLGISAEAWIFSRALRVRHATAGPRAFVVFAAPLLLFTVVVLLITFAAAVYNASL